MQPPATRLSRPRVAWLVVRVGERVRLLGGKALDFLQSFSE